MDISLNLDELREEIDFLRHTYSIKRAVSALSCRSPAITDKQKDRRNSANLVNTPSTRDNRVNFRTPGKEDVEGQSGTCWALACM